MVPEDNAVYIVHAIPPYALIRAIMGQHRPKMTVFNQYAFRNSDGIIEDWTLYIHYVEMNAENAEKLLDRAWRWYRAYMEWEDKNNNENEHPGNI